MKVLEYLFAYLFGALGYGGIEMLWRGRTHWTMLMLGGICFLCVYCIAVSSQFSLPGKWTLCTFSITSLEFLCGIVVNLRLGWNVWDYSIMPGNLLGQICPLYALYWFLLSIPCTALAQGMHRYVFSNYT